MCARVRARLARTGGGGYDCYTETTGLPGGDLIAEGLEDLARGTESMAAFLVSIGAPRLRDLGFNIPRPLPDPEGGLYALLAQSDSDSAHGRYNALIRRLVSFERAAAITG